MVKQLSVRLGNEAEAQLDALAERWHTTLGGAIRRAIEEADGDDVVTRLEQVATRLEALASAPATPAPRTPTPGKASPPPAPRVPADTWDASRAVPKSRQLRDAGKR